MQGPTVCDLATQKINKKKRVYVCAVTWWSKKYIYDVTYTKSEFYILRHKTGEILSIQGYILYI